MSRGVIGNTSDSGSEELRFDPLRDSQPLINFKFKLIFRLSNYLFEEIS